MKIARESLPFVAAIVAVGAVAWLVHPGLAALPLLALLFTLWFFRDPERSTPEDPLLLISPADGKVIMAGPDQISIFMNVFNVHVCRAPTAGRVESVEHVPGRFMAAFKDEASSHNERSTITLADGDRRQPFTLVAGLIARRIVCKVTPGQSLRAGERVGLIRFGSRVDVALPVDRQAAVRVGQHVLAGETVIARPAEAPGG